MSNVAEVSQKETLLAVKDIATEPEVTVKTEADNNVEHQNNSSVFIQNKDDEKKVHCDDVGNVPYEKRYSSADDSIDKVTDFVKKVTLGTAGATLDITGFGVKTIVSVVENIGEKLVIGAGKFCNAVNNTIASMFDKKKEVQP